MPRKFSHAYLALMGSVNGKTLSYCLLGKDVSQSDFDVMRTSAYVYDGSMIAVGFIIWNSENSS